MKTNLKDNISRFSKHTDIGHRQALANFIKNNMKFKIKEDLALVQCDVLEDIQTYFKEMFRVYYFSILFKVLFLLIQ